MSTPRPDGPRKMARVPNDTAILMTVEQAARWSGIPYTTLLQWVHEGILPVVQPPGKKRYWIRRAALLACMAAWEYKGA
jgi:excisionase family DNA binding protein